MGRFYKIENINDFLKTLMVEKIVDALILPLKNTPFLIKDVSLIEKTEPFSHCKGINTAREISKLTFKGAFPFKVGVLLKPCELRAYRELIKLNQINPENIITISFDCKGYEDREICEMCIDFLPEYADIQLFQFGSDGFVVTSDISLPFEEIDFSNEKREEEVNKLIEKRKEVRVERMKEIKENFRELLKDCIVCFNCMRVCPICFCQECFFSSPNLKGDSTTYLMRASRLNGLNFPENKLLFHLGRMNHMSVSCVNCGTCEDACPSKIPVAQMFATAGDEVKKLFNYTPGKSLEDKIPFTCYQHDELHDFEKEYK